MTLAPATPADLDLAEALAQARYLQSEHRAAMQSNLDTLARVRRIRRLVVSFRGTCQNPGERLADILARFRLALGESHLERPLYDLFGAPKPAEGDRDAWTLDDALILFAGECEAPRPPDLAPAFPVRQRHAEVQAVIDASEVAWRRRTLLLHRLRLLLAVTAGEIAEDAAVAQSGLRRAEWDLFRRTEEEADPGEDRSAREGWILEVSS